MDTGYKFKTEKEAYKFLNLVYELNVEGVNFFIDDSKEPCGIVVIRFRGHANISELDGIASGLGGGRMYLPLNWRRHFNDYELACIESFE